MTTREALGVIKEIHSGTSTTLMQEQNDFGREQILLNDCKALSIAAEALEKQIPQPAEMREDWTNICPNCKQIIMRGCAYCDLCGQAISWEE